jgi:hypothetical protein
MLVLTQLSAGAFLYLSLVAGARQNGAIAALAVACVSLGASTLHLGRPVHAWRALKMWRRSWLSREVLLFSLFAAAAVAAVSDPRDLVRRRRCLGFGGVTASAFIYLVPARPAWNRKGTRGRISIDEPVAGSRCFWDCWGSVFPRRRSQRPARRNCSINW